MKGKFHFILIAAMAFIYGFNQQAEKAHVRTKYHVHKVNYPGNSSNNAQTDTFYFTIDGKGDFNRNGITNREERRGDTIERTSFDKSGKLIGSSISILNKQGLEDSVIYKNATHVTFAHKYLYDGDGNLIEDRNYPEQPPNLIIKYKIVDGNRVEEWITNLPSDDTVYMPNPQTGKMDTIVERYWDDVYHNEFYTDKPNMPTNENFGYLGRDNGNKNLEKKSVQLTLKGDTQDVFYFRYLFDDKGWVTSVAKASRSGEEYDSTAYTYY